MYNGQAYFDPKQRIATGKTIPACPKKDYPDIKNCPTTDFNLDFQVVIATAQVSGQRQCRRDAV